MAINEKYREKLLAIIKKHVPDCTVYLFGSRATNKERMGSDIDLALDAGMPIEHKKILAIYRDFNKTNIPLKVDVVDLQIASDELKGDVLREGIKWKN